VPTSVGTDGIARWNGPLPTWLAAFPDDPRIQFRGKLVARSPVSLFSLYRTQPADRAMWTGSGIDGDGALIKGRTGLFVLDRASARAARSVVLKLQAPTGTTAPVRWRMTRGGKEVARGRIAPSRSVHARLAVPPCAAAVCKPVSWRLTARGPTLPTPFPVYGAPPPPRPVLLYVYSAAIR
jgi:hypothetical protein